MNSNTKTLSLIFILFSSYTVTLGQNIGLNSISIEAMGANVQGLGLTYERYYPVSEQVNLSTRIGVGLVTNNEITSHLGGSLLFGKKLSAEVGLNNLINPVFDDFNDYELSSNFTLQPLLGIRYISKVSVRFFLVPPFGAFEPDLLPFSGLSLGYFF